MFFTLSKIISTGDPYMIGVDVGGTNLRVGVVNKHTVVWEQRVQADFAAFCREQPPDAALDFILDTLAAAIQEAKARYPQASTAGIGFPGFIDPKTQAIAQSPNLPGLRDVDLVTPLTRKLGIPVLVENDALAAGYGEYMAHPDDATGLVYMGLGTGVGGSVILDGKPYAGAHGVSMEIGHLIVEPGGRLCGCGNRGCLEQYSSARGIAMTYAELSHERDLDSALVAAFARDGNPHALEAYRRGGEVLAQGLASILKVLDVSLVVIGGGVSQSWDLMRDAFDARLDADLIPALRGRVKVQISYAEDQAGIVGAATLAFMAGKHLSDKSKS